MFYVLEVERETKQAMVGKIDCMDIGNYIDEIVPTMSVRRGVKIPKPGCEINRLKPDLNDTFMLIAFLHQLSAFRLSTDSEDGTNAILSASEAPTQATLFLHHINGLDDRFAHHQRGATRACHHRGPFENTTSMVLPKPKPRS